MIIDVCSYNGERELFDLRYNILSPFVDEFIVVEFDQTFSGKPKTCSFQNAGLNLLPKVKYYFNDLNVWLKYRELAENSPNTKGAEHWKTEFMQKESIKDCLTQLKDDDLVFIGDADEIWDIRNKYTDIVGVLKLRLDVYTYYLNNKSTEKFWGTIAGRYKSIKNKCLNHLRTDSEKTDFSYGWHFTNMGGYKAVEKKLLDSYTDESYANEVVMAYLGKNIQENKDFLGRDFKYEIDESEWPPWLKENRERFAHLLK
jgi:hypothetical protein